MFTNSFSFKGRIRRKEYLFSFLYQFVVLIHPYYFIYYMIKSYKNHYKINYPKFSTLYYIITYIIFSLCLGMITKATKDLNTSEYFKIFIASLYVVPGIILYFWFIFAQATKRCHDIGNSGWFQLIPFYGLFLIFEKGQIGENEYGLNPKELKNEISSIEIVNEIASPNYIKNYYKSFKCFFATKIKKLTIKKLTSDEVIIISIIIGSICFLISGNVFGEIKYDGEYDKEIIDFNYITAIISFIVTAGISYIFLNRKSNNTN